MYYQNITTDGTHIIMDKTGSTTQIFKPTNIIIANKDNTSSNIITLRINDSSNQYCYFETVLPARASLQFDIPPFEVTEFNLELITDDNGGTTDISVITSGAPYYASRVLNY
jgi:hypothetical protein